MSLYRRKDSRFWWGEFRLPGRKALQRSSGTEDRTQAQEWHDRKQGELWRETRLGDRPSRTWKAAVIRWSEENGDKDDAPGDIQKFKWFDQYFGKLTLDQMTTDVVMDAVNAKLKEKTKRGKPISKSTANRYLSLVRSVLRAAASPAWGWIPHPPSFKQHKEPKGRVRHLTKEQAVTLLAELPEHLRLMTIFSLSVGVRQANVKGLRWSQVDLGRRVAWIHADETKGGDAIGIPLNDPAIAVLQAQLGKHKEFVFTYGKKRPRPLRNVNTRAWQKALRRAKITDFRWHDLRHTWASWLTMAGASLRDVQEMGGWKSRVMVDRYAHLSPEHLASAAARLNGILQSNIIMPSYESPTATKPGESQAVELLAPRPGLEPGTCGLTVSLAKKKKAA